MRALLRVCLLPSSVSSILWLDCLFVKHPGENEKQAKLNIPMLRCFRAQQITQTQLKMKRRVVCHTRDEVERLAAPLPEISWWKRQLWKMIANSWLASRKNEKH